MVAPGSYTRTASLSVFVHGAGIGLAFLAQVVIARLLGAGEFGLFAWSMAAVNASVVLARAGLDTTTLRFGAASLGRGDTERFAALVKFAQRRVFLLSLAIVPLLIAGMILARGADTAGVVHVAVICGLWFPLLAVNGVRQSALLARGWVVRSYAPETIVRPIVLLLGITVAGYAAHATASAAVASAGVATLVAYLVGRYWIKDLVQAARHSVITLPDRAEWGVASRGLFGLTIAYAALAQIDLLALGAVATPTDLGVYSAAKQIASVSLLGLFAIQSGMSPALAAAHADGDQARLEAAVNFVAWIGLAFAASTTIFILVAKNMLLSMFGSEFRQGVNALYLLLAAQLVVAVNGPAGVVASMTGCHAAATKAYAVAIIAVTGITVVLYGALGIAAPALGVLVGAILWATILRVHLRRNVGVNTFPQLRPLARAGHS